MEPFRPTRGGGARASLAAAEASLLRSLVGQVISLIAPDGPPARRRQRRPAGPLGRRAGRRADRQTPDDPGAGPAAARRLPRRSRGRTGVPQVHRVLRCAAPSTRPPRRCWTRCPRTGGKIQLTADQAQAWLKALNDVRLALGVRLGVTEEFEEQWGRLAADDPQWAAYEVYAWLGAVQESLVQALA